MQDSCPINARPSYLNVCMYVRMIEAPSKGPSQTWFSGFAEHASFPCRPTPAGSKPCRLRL